jgi:hypothetical protein
MPDQVEQPPRHHLLIAGTGRAGTSFLVRWLAAAGLRTHLSAHDTPMWDDAANAGLEDLPLATDWQTAPYVMKSPWLVEVIDEVLANPRIVLDGVIIPVRELTEAAASRVVQELQAAHRKNPWMTGLSRGFEQWGTTPGGVVYSLDPVDQARLLAVSFHRLVQRLVKADIPIVFLDFPRLALDAEYLFRKLRRFVPATNAQALAAHAEIADPEKIRVDREFAALREGHASGAEYQALDSLNAVALGREVRRLLGELAEAERAATAQREEAAGLRSALDVQAVDLVGLAPASEASDADRLASEARVATLIATVEKRRAEAEHAAAGQQEAMAGLRGALEAQAAELAGLVATLGARNADWQVAQAQIATLTAMTEARRAETDRTTAAQQAEVAGLRGALDARASELAGLLAVLRARDATLAERDATLAAHDAVLAERDARLAGRDAMLAERDADLERAQAHIASLQATVEQWRTDAERAAMDHRAVVAGLRNTLDARAADLAGLATTLEARDADLAAAHVRLASLTAVAEQQRGDAERAAVEQRAVIGGLRAALDDRSAELAGVVATLEARDALLEAARAQVASLIATAEQRQADAGRVAMEQQAAASGLRGELHARSAELAGAVATLDARDADLEAARAQIASLIATAEQRQADAGHAVMEQQAVVAGLRGALEARSAELDGFGAALRARDADLAAAQAQIAALTAVAEQLRSEREDLLASWTWKAGRPFRRVHRASRAMVAALGLGRPPAA